MGSPHAQAPRPSGGSERVDDVDVANISSLAYAGADDAVVAAMVDAVMVVIEEMELSRKSRRELEEDDGADRAWHWLKRFTRRISSSSGGGGEAKVFMAEAGSAREQLWIVNVVIEG
mmetsp:Transcript_17470/g.37766  ORF Transcript_17470/g.37766 Transcript_17470/m.37766 type:complete len:117 (+) Transcript_17470:2566-2916(+)